MDLRLVLALFLLALLPACSATRVVRLDLGRSPSVLHKPYRTDAGPVELKEEAFTRFLATEIRHRDFSANPEQDARALWGVLSRSGWYEYTKNEGVVPLSVQPLDSHWADVDVRITHQYLRLCAKLGTPGDCRGILMTHPVITGDGRYALAMSFALEEVLPEMTEAFKDMANPEAIKAAILWTMTLYAAMWVVPEPVFSKGLAAVMTATFICYIGVDTFWTLIQGWRSLVEMADMASSLSEFREAGRRYGKVMGKNAARAFALLLTTAIGQTAASFSAKVPTLPGSAQASAVGAAQAGLRLTQVAQVETVAVTATAVTIALAPNAVASVAQSVRGAVAMPVDAEGPVHHIATDKWNDATHSGGPWTPKFQRIFDRAGMSLNDQANKVNIKGHQGPHPQEYHERIYERLDEATKGCVSIQQCQEALTAELQRLAKLISTENTSLNKLVTRRQ